MKNNKLTLKSLQQELDNMKLKTGSKNKTKSAVTPKLDTAVGHDIKNSYIQRLYMRSGAFTLYLLTGILGYAHKLPIIGKIVTLLAAWYGKTTIWKMLVLSRKLFIVINAIIGVYVVFKTAGFSVDNLMIGWAAVGEAYLQSLITLTGKLFRWFVELFDHKVIPNVPGDNGGTWFNKPLPPKNKNIFVPSNLNIPNIIESDGFSLRNLYKDATTSHSTSWYKDTNTWFWIVTGVVSVGILYVGYQLICDPLYLSSLFKSTPTITTQGPTPPANPTDVDPDITLAGPGSSGFSNVTKKLVSVYKSSVRVLNPFYWYPSVSDTESQFRLFMEVQNDMNRANRSLYPFTPNNPFNSWFTKLKIHYIGESAPEFLERTRDKLLAERVYNSLAVSKGKMIDVAGGSPATIFSANSSPGITPATVLGLNPIWSPSAAGPSMSVVIDKASVLLTESKLENLAELNPTPTKTPAEWASHVVDKGPDAYSALDAWKAKRSIFNIPIPSSKNESGSSNIFYDVIDSPTFNVNDFSSENVSNAIAYLESHNKYSVLTEYYI